MATTNRTSEPTKRALGLSFQRVRRRNTGLWFVLPAILTLALVIGYPVVYTFQLSLSKYRLGQVGTPFIGLQNYSDVLADQVFRTTLRNTLAWTLFSVVFIIVLGLLAALVVNESFRGRIVVRSLLLIPWIIPGIVAAVTWRWLYHPDFGIINQYLLRLGLIQTNTNWLANPSVGLYAVVVVNVWKGFPLAMLMLLAGLQNAPEESFDAARVDGANAWQRFRYVTLPHLRPVLLVLALLLTIWNMNTFTYVYVLTGGGPMRLTEVLGVYIYNMAFQSFQFGLASAAAVIVFVISTILSVLYLVALRSGID